MCFATCWAIEMHRRLLNETFVHVRVCVKEGRRERERERERERMYVLGVTGVQPRMPTHVDLMDLQPPDYKLLVFCIRAHCFNDTRKCWVLMDVSPHLLACCQDWNLLHVQCFFCFVLVSLCLVLRAWKGLAPMPVCNFDCAILSLLFFHGHFQCTSL